MTSLSYLLALLVTSEAAALILVIVLYHKSQTRWMRIFSERQGIPAITMESKPREPKPEIAETPKVKSRMSIPIPGAQMFRKTS